MELVVGGHEFLEVALLCKLLLARDRRVEVGDDRRIMADRQRANDLQLNRLSQEVCLLRQAHIDPADDGGILREDVDQAFLREPHQRIADRCRTDPELARQRSARQR